VGWVTLAEMLGWLACESQFIICGGSESFADDLKGTGYCKNDSLSGTKRVRKR